MGDERLFGLAARGDERAFELIYQRHHQALYRYCRSIVGNGEDAADALQSTMASALRALPGERREIAVKPWLFRIAHNESISLLRKRRAHTTIEDAAELEAPPHDLTARLRLAQLVTDIEQLPDGQRGALVMHELSGLRHREIGEALGTTEKHARQLVYEARTALHDMEKGRSMQCEDVRRVISDNDARVLRGRGIRAHIRGCKDCSQFAAVIGTRKRDLAAIAPPIPAGLAAALLHNIIGGGGSGGAGVGTVAAGKTLTASMLGKAGAIVAVATVAGAGTIEVRDARHHAPPPPSAAQQHKSAGTPGTAAASANAAASPAAASTLGPGALIKLAAGKHGAAAPSGKHPAHPSHPQSSAKTPASTTAPGTTSHPIHPVHPTHPTHPAHPAHPAHPTHPSTPSQGNGQSLTPGKGKSTAPGQLKQNSSTTPTPTQTQTESTPVVTLPTLPIGSGCPAKGQATGNPHC
jgi:RNA polymerase sigma factor (sigma-70 family)